jgi:hypothetical protein
MTEALAALTLKCTIVNLQKTADLYGQGPQAQAHTTNLRMLYVTGAPLAWRIIETQEKNTAKGTKRLCRMHSFATLEKTRACLVERVAFRKAENSLIARYQARVESSAQVGEVDAARERLRERLCKTQPDRTRVLAWVA